ncbi:MAG: hypothetical protein RJA44_1337, partial [Pseudomonadota bacterium]
AAAQLGQDGADQAFLRAKCGTTRHYMTHVMAEAGALRDIVIDGAAGTLALDDAQF